MTNLEWAVLHLPNYAVNRARVRGKVRVYSINMFGVQRSVPCIWQGYNDDHKSGWGRVVITVAKRGAPKTMRWVEQTNVITLAEYVSRKANVHV